jgi:hypothetical protein
VRLSAFSTGKTEAITDECHQLSTRRLDGVFGGFRKGGHAMRLVSVTDAERLGGFINPPRSGEAAEAIGRETIYRAGGRT